MDAEAFMVFATLSFLRRLFVIADGNAKNGYFSITLSFSPTDSCLWQELSPENKKTQSPTDFLSECSSSGANVRLIPGSTPSIEIVPIFTRTNRSVG
jgi:hypothetical protein